jgi:hypothetical protein
MYIVTSRVYHLRKWRDLGGRAKPVEADRCENTATFSERTEVQDEIQFKNLIYILSTFILQSR